MTKESKGLVISVAGYHGSGRSSQALKIAETFGLRYISSGMLFRERAYELGVSLEEMNKIASQELGFDNWLDTRTKIESRKGDVVIDANLSSWMAEDPDLKIFVTCPFEKRVKRISERENRTIDEIRQETQVREELEHKRYLEYYNVDINDLTIYDVIINTGLFSLDATSRILKNIIEEYLISRC